MEINIPENEVLSRVHIFELDKEMENGEVGTLFVNVNEILVGEDKGKFIAIPNIIVKDAPKEYWYVGNSLESALNGSLRLISGKSFEKILSTLMS